MAPRARLPAPLVLAALLSLAALLPAATADRHDPCRPDDPTCGVVVPEECKAPGSSSASIANVMVGGVVLQTQAGSATLLLPRGVLASSMGASTTGNLDVQVQHRCVMSYTVSWTVTGHVGSSSGSETAFPLCVSGMGTHQIPVGNDVADVHIDLAWVGCDGSKGNDSRDVKVVDPALGL